MFYLERARVGSILHKPAILTEYLLFIGPLQQQVTTYSTRDGVISLGKTVQTLIKLFFIIIESQPTTSTYNHSFRSPVLNCNISYGRTWDQRLRNDRPISRVSHIRHHAVARFCLVILRNEFVHLFGWLPGTAFPVADDDHHLQIYPGSNYFIQEGGVCV